MLPDYPRTKALLEKVVQRRIDLARQNRLGVFSEVRMTRLHEGDRSKLHRDDGSKQTVNMRNLSASTTVRHPTSRAEPLTVQQILQVADSLGRGMAEQQIKLMVEQIDIGATKAGNVATSGTSMAEQLIEMQEVVHTEYDECGLPVPQVALLGSSGMHERFVQAVKEIESNPVLRERYENAMALQRQKWRDREDLRKLAE